MSQHKLAKAVGINHVSMEVGDIAKAVEFYSSIFDIEVVYEDNLGISKQELASIELGDQFIALTFSDRRQKDIDRHIGLVVDDKDKVIKRIEELGIELLPGPTFTFLDPWGNRIEVVSYQNIMFSKIPGVLKKMGVEEITKNDRAITKMRDRGFIED